MTQDAPDLLGRLVARFVGVRGPTDPDAARVWTRTDEAERQRLLWAATDPGAAGHLASDRDRWIVDELAADRSRRRGLDIATPVLTGLLVLSTLWGFGRAAFPATASSFLVVGLVGLAVTTVVGWRRGARRRTAARQVRRRLRGMPPD